jgi:hypothetical protein
MLCAVQRGAILTFLHVCFGAVIARPSTAETVSMYANDLPASHQPLCMARQRAHRAVPGRVVDSVLPAWLSSPHAIAASSAHQFTDKAMLDAQLGIYLHFRLRP